MSRPPGRTTPGSDWLGRRGPLPFRIFSGVRTRHFAVKAMSVEVGLVSRLGNNVWHRSPRFAVMLWN